MNVLSRPVELIWRKIIKSIHRFTAQHFSDVATELLGLHQSFAEECKSVWLNDGCLTRFQIAPFTTLSNHFSALSRMSMSSLLNRWTECSKWVKIQQERGPSFPAHTCLRPDIEATFSSHVTWPGRSTIHCSLMKTQRFGRSVNKKSLAMSPVTNLLFSSLRFIYLQIARLVVWVRIMGTGTCTRPWVRVRVRVRDHI